MLISSTIHALRPQPLGGALGCDALDGTAQLILIQPVNGGEPLAQWREENPLAHVPALAPEAPASVLALWSGWIPSTADPRATGIHTWTGQGWSQFASLCDRLRPRLTELGRSVLFRPHASHVLSDPRSCLTFFNERDTPTLGLLLDPVAMLTPSMLADAPDHLDRILGTLVSHPATRAVILTDAAPSGEDRLSQVPLGRGELPPALIARIAQRASDAGLPIVLVGDPEPQLAMLNNG